MEKDIKITNEIIEENDKDFLNKATLTLKHKPKLSDFILAYAEMISKYGDVYVDVNSIRFVEESE